MKHFLNYNLSFVPSIGVILPFEKNLRICYITPLSIYSEISKLILSVFIFISLSGTCSKIVYTHTLVCMSEKCGRYSKGTVW